MSALAIVFFLLTPAFLVYLCQRFPRLDKVGTVVLAFAAGILLATTGGLTSLFPGLDLIPLQTEISEIAIALAIPMLVFSINVKSTLGLAGQTMKSMCIALITVVATSTTLAWLFQDKLAHIWQIAGMSVGAYTGGGPNMAAIKTAIEGDQAIFVTMTTYDILLSAIYLLFVMTLAKPIFGRFLRPYQTPMKNETDRTSEFEHMADESAQAYRKLLQAEGIRQSLKSLLVAALVVAASLGLASLLPPGIRSAATIILITSIGVACSFVPGIRALTHSFQVGMYLILVFCFTMGALTDTSILTSLNPYLFYYILLILLGSMLIHALLCRFFNIDTDTFLITVSAAIMSVPFIPVIASALKNRALILPGFAAAILGYVMGNYLGILTAYTVRWLLA